MLTLLPAGRLLSQPPPPLPRVTPNHVLRFPYDEGSHPEFRTEWWYVTGWLNLPKGPDIGFQITFFRTRPELRTVSPGSFSPGQIFIAHAALSDPQQRGLFHDQRAARPAFGLAGALQGRTQVWIDDWSLEQSGTTYRARLPTRAFDLELELERQQPPLLHGSNGVSRKGPHPDSASYYYSLPQLLVRGRVTRNGQRATVTGRAWLDHEWSSSYMDSAAVGWDWYALNLDDGGALMAFRMRDGKGGSLWAGGTHRRPDGTVRVFEPDEIRFRPLRHWRSPRTGAVYPVEWEVHSGSWQFRLRPLLDNQEQDTRTTTGAAYYEGAVEALAGTHRAGRGYLELTGYLQPLRL